MIAAVVFDLDGVLIDSEPVWERVRRELVAERGGHWGPDAQRRLMGMSTQYPPDPDALAAASLVLPSLAEVITDAISALG